LRVKRRERMKRCAGRKRVGRDPEKNSDRKNDR